MNANPRRLISPTYFNSFIIVAIILHFIFPIQTVVGFPLKLTGIIPLIIGMFINLHARRTLREKGTTDNFSGIPQALITEGFFRYSRNPTYLGGIIFSFGLAIVLGSLVSFIFPIALFLLLNFLYIPNEENRLRPIFGKEYYAYEKRVRKWI